MTLRVARQLQAESANLSSNINSSQPSATPRERDSTLRSLPGRRRSPFKNAGAFKLDHTLNSTPRADSARPSSPFKSAPAFNLVSVPIASRAAEAAAVAAGKRQRAGLDTRKDFELAQLLSSVHAPSYPLSSASSESGSTCSSHLETALHVLDARLPNTLALMDYLNRPECLASPSRTSSLIGTKQSYRRPEQPLKGASSRMDSCSRKSSYTALYKDENGQPAQYSSNMAPKSMHLTAPLLAPDLFDHSRRIQTSADKTFSQHGIPSSMRMHTKVHDSTRFQDLYNRLRNLPSSEPQTRKSMQPATPKTPTWRPQHLQQSQGLARLSRSVQSPCRQSPASEPRPRMQMQPKPSTNQVSTPADKFVTMSKKDRRVSRVPIPACFQA
ncbi:hypothetical protein BCR37DRAFT_303017 [Protomyces lactucae-debilis]|uniref:Uncharacterized protein n=1 Tax=Protomyces lactucae-debilis TaxID=2754530 RepID=A0A1Y2FEV0_PROLT|nr:uncharacterized protein BCR37DRAFT_303017 [Protomyces lactucae-debilis]ORY82432.1 hypothetical protein BCR37DRAFT_303017 [Protomyces lactucae-debilis]